jgi:hypothetical protein
MYIKHRSPATRVTFKDARELSLLIDKLQDLRVSLTVAGNSGGSVTHATIITDAAQTVKGSITFIVDDI